MIDVSISVKLQSLYLHDKSDIWAKAFKHGPSKICGRQPLKNLMEYGQIF